MLPQQGVPNFNLRIKEPILAALIMVLVFGLLLTLSFYLNTAPGDLAAQNRTKLSLIVTTLLSAMLLIAGTAHWWHAHLWRHGNSQSQHRHRTKHPRHRHKHERSSRSRR